MSAPDLGPFDSIYVSRDADDAAVSCPGRIVWERARGVKTLVVSLAPGAAAAPAAPPATERLAVEHLALGVPDRSLDPAEWVTEVGGLLRDVAIRARAQNVYVPLGVDPEDRPAHEAGMLVSQAVGTRNLFFYEERPYVFLPGSVRFRLAQLGARLPPGATLADRGGVLRLLLRFHASPYLGGVRRGWTARLRWTRAALRQWLDARGWRPQRAYGPSLQPVLHPVASDLLPAVQEATLAWAAARRFPASAGRLLGFGARYARRLGGDGHVERYWLLLPQRSAEGLTLLPSASAHDPVVV